MYQLTRLSESLRVSEVGKEKVEPHLKTTHTNWNQVSCEPRQFPFQRKSAAYVQLNPLKKSSELATSSSRPDIVSLPLWVTVSGTWGDAGPAQTRDPVQPASEAPTSSSPPPRLCFRCCLGGKEPLGASPEPRKGPTRTQTTWFTSPSGTGWPQP